MDAVRDGSESAYTTLFARHKAPLYGYLTRMSRRTEVADELFQETFLRIHRSRSTWSHHDGTFRSWMYRIATNAMRDRARSQARKPETLDDSREAVHSSSVIDHIALERALGELPDNLREAFSLTAVLGLDHNEVGAALEITPENARARVSRARAKLREALVQ